MTGTRAFDKEKEQKRLRQVQLISEIGTQTMDIVRTQGEINANKAAREELSKKNIEPPAAGASDQDKEIYQKQLIATDAYKSIMSRYGTGGSYQKATQAVTAVLQGLSGGNIGSALAGASAPYLAGAIHEYAGDDPAARLMAHAVLGALVAQAQGNTAGAGAVGGVVAASGTGYIMQSLYGTTQADELNESQKQTVSALVALASGLSGGLTTGNLSGAVTGAQAGKNASENNDMSWFPGDPKFGQAATTMGQYVLENGGTPEQASEAMRAIARGDGYDGPDPAKGLAIGAGMVAAGGAVVMVSQELAAFCFAAPGVCNSLAISAAEIAGGDAALGGTALGVLGGFGGLVVKEWGTGTKATSSWDNAISKVDGDFGYLPPVRQNYVKDVYGLQETVDKMRASGAKLEEIAKYAYGARNELKMKYREYTPSEMLDVIDARNMERYGNRIGPRFDDLIKKGKTFDQII